jgi:hypothetical protein
MHHNGKEKTMTLRPSRFHSTDESGRQWSIAAVQKPFSNMEQVVPSHAAEGMMERMIIVHGMIVKIAENLPRNDLNSLRRDDIVGSTMIEHDGDVNARGQVGLKVSQIKGGGQQNQLPDCSGVPAGIDGGHESSVAGSDQDQIGPARKDAIQSVHSLVQRAGKVLKDHIGKFIPEKFAFCTTACAFKAVNKDACRGHDRHLCIENGRPAIAFPLR